METNQKSLTNLGTAKQGGLIRQLASDLGFQDAESAVTSVGMSSPLSVQDASKVIDLLKAKVDEKPDSKAEGGKRKFLTARTLLLIHNGSIETPEQIDPDAAEVLQRLAKLRDIERVLGSVPRWGGVNNGGPILVEQLVEHFGSLESVAAAFGVGADTVRGWGPQLPDKRAFEAEVKTKGYVCASRR